MTNPGNYTTPEPDELEKRLEQLERPIRQEEEEALGDIEAKREKFIATRRGSLLGRMALRLGFDGSKGYNRDIRTARLQIMKKHRVSLKETTKLQEVLEIARFERLDPEVQAAMVEHAAWSAARRRPKVSPKKLERQENRLEFGGPPLDLSVPVPVCLPALGLTVTQIFNFAGEHVDYDHPLPELDDWINGERGGLEGRRVYLTNAYTMPGQTFRIPIERDYLLSHMSTLEMWEIFKEARHVADFMD